jgi:hypothetical protein
MSFIFGRRYKSILLLSAVVRSESAGGGDAGADGALRVKRSAAHAAAPDVPAVLLLLELRLAGLPKQFGVFLGAQIGGAISGPTWMKVVLETP